MSLAVLVLEMLFDVLYFHSCGIVGIMMVMVKLAHLFAVYELYVECELWVSCGIMKRRLHTIIICENAVVSSH